ncbi:hypothetical protein ACFL2A_00515 [Thermodesulfobacteriota bacterium]
MPENPSEVAEEKLTGYRKLQPEPIRDKIGVLRARVHERFPESGLSQVCNELFKIAQETRSICEDISKPHKGLRVGVSILILAMLTVLVEGIIAVPIPNQRVSFTELVSVVEAGLNTLALIGAAIFFLVTMENRIKRTKTLKAINSLRVAAHVIDMHQLSKDPSHNLYEGVHTKASPKRTLSPFELTRYLDYCSEMLSLVGKVAALHAQNFSDSVVLSSVNEVEALTTGLCRKIWQKIMVTQLSNQDEELTE